MLTPALRHLADEHVTALARRHRIRVRRTKTWATSEAELVSRQVFIPARTRTAVDYLAALHEIGHLVDPAASNRDKKYRDNFPRSTRREAQYDLMIVEAAAWAWALKHALPAVLKNVSRAEWRRIGNCWVSHAGDVW